MVQRLTYRRRHSYASRSNKQRIVKTPGGKLVYQLLKNWPEKQVRLLCEWYLRVRKSS